MNFDLEKATEQVTFILEKKQIPNVRAQVAVNLDVSGSARNLFAQGLMQEAFQRIMPIALKFDLNGAVDVFTFADGNSIAHVESEATAKNYSNYVKKNILDNSSVPKWGGTDYAPVLKENLESFEFISKEVVTEKKGWFGGSSTTTTKETLNAKSKSGDPVVVYFFTDGANSDKSATTALLQSMQNAKTQMYVHFIGIGDADFSYIQKLGDKFDNTGFLSIKNLSKVDDSIYEQLIPDELVEWFKSR